MWLCYHVTQFERTVRPDVVNQGRTTAWSEESLILSVHDGEVVDRQEVIPHFLQLTRDTIQVVTLITCVNICITTDNDIVLIPDFANDFQQ